MKESLIVGMALGAIAGALYVSNSKKIHDTVEKGKKQVKKHNGYTLYKVDGFTVKMGKNNLQNDELLENAERLDIWLHTKNYHSSFVMIETKGKEVPIAVILSCA